MQIEYHDIPLGPYSISMINNKRDTKMLQKLEVNSIKIYLNQTKNGPTLKLSNKKINKLEYT